MIAFSSLTTETESPKNKQRTAHEQEQKVNSFNHSRYVDQASLIYILAACHSASLAEEVTWAPLHRDITYIHVPLRYIEVLHLYRWYTHTRPTAAGQMK